MNVFLGYPELCVQKEIFNRYLKLIDVSEMNHYFKYAEISSPIKYVENNIVLHPFSNDSVLSASENLAELVDIGQLLSSIGDYGFSNCLNLTSISLPETIEIGRGAFYECSNLSYIDISSATVIRSYAFQSCTSIIDISCLNVLVIKDKAFYLCNSLTSAYLPNLTAFQMGAFMTCLNLISVICPNVKSFETYVFNGCKNLKYLDMSNSDTVIALPNVNVFNSVTNMSCFVKNALVNSYKSANNWSTLVKKKLVIFIGI